jgi:DNA replication protein DnaC
MDYPTPSITSFDDFKALVPNCQHGGKVGFCDVCAKEREDRKASQSERDNIYDAKQERDREERQKEDYEHPEQRMKFFIPRKFLDRSLDNFSGAEPIKQLCREYANGFIRKLLCVGGRPLGDEGLVQYPGSILFVGKTGCGKTHLAVAIVRELVKRGVIVDAKFITAPELLLEIRATFGKQKKQSDPFDGGRDPDTEGEVIDRYSKCELLILDDLGSEKVSDFTIQSLYLVIDRRNRELKPTIVTTNLSLEEIETQIDARMASRLADMKVVKLTMPDYRKKR